MAMIREAVRSKVLEGINALMQTYEEGIDRAYLKSEQDLTVNFGASLSAGKNPDEITVEVNISFVNERTKDKLKLIANEKQGRMFDGPDGLSRVK